jgi:hypothetical protein
MLVPGTGTSQPPMLRERSAPAVITPEKPAAPPSLQPAPNPFAPRLPSATLPSPADDADEEDEDMYDEDMDDENDENEAEENEDLV